MNEKRYICTECYHRMSILAVCCMNHHCQNRDFIITDEDYTYDEAKKYKSSLGPAMKKLIKEANKYKKCHREFMDRLYKDFQNQLTEEEKNTYCDGGLREKQLTQKEKHVKNSIRKVNRGEKGTKHDSKKEESREKKGCEESCSQESCEKETICKENEQSSVCKDASCKEGVRNKGD